MELEKNFQAAVPPTLLQQAQEAAQANRITLDELAVEALKQHLGRQALQRLRREAEGRRGSLTDEQVESLIEQAIHEHRDEQRGR